MNFKDKYIDLLLEKGVVKGQNKLFISYNSIEKKFIKRLIVRARKMGFSNIITSEENYSKTRKLLYKLSEDEIKVHPYFLRKEWDFAAKNHYAFLMTSSYPTDKFDDIAKSKLSAYQQAQSKTYQLYLQKVQDDLISWTIFPLANKDWANKIYGNKNSYKLLSKNINYSCMLNTKNPIESWNNYIKIENKKVNYLNNLEIKKLLIKNSLGTMLTMEFAKDSIFRCLQDDRFIENIPTYSIWTTPHKYKVDGIVYGSIPIYRNNRKISNYWFKFKNGKIMDCGANEGKDCLDFLIKQQGCNRLGELALIDYNSPVSKTKTIYFSNVLDENLSTHLALGMAYKNTIKDFTKLTDEDFDKIGCNINCEDHIDFTIGTSDMQVIAKLQNGQEVEIYSNGKFNYHLINEQSPFAD